LGRVEGIEGYHDITRYPDASQIPGLLLFRWDAPLFFANAELFNNGVLEVIGSAAMISQRTCTRDFAASSALTLPLLTARRVGQSCDTIPFITIWYSAAILLCAFIGAKLGPRLLRW
jgi:MFS superfamily sulfate permease-like transporter